MTSPSVTGTIEDEASDMHYAVRWWRVLRSEWGKLWSLRSTWSTLAMASAVVVGLGLVGAVVYDPDVEIPDGAPAPPGIGVDNAVEVALSGLSLALLVVGVLGVLTMAGEYGSGTIRSTLTAVPRRLPVLWAKVGLVAIVAGVVTAIAAVLAFLVGIAPLSGTGLTIGIGDSGVLRSLAGAGVYLGLVAAIGVGLGALLRSTAAGVAVLVAVFLVLPGLTGLLPDAWVDAVSPYLPSNAGSALTALTRSSDELAPAAGLGVLMCWTTAILAAAAVRLRKCDV